MTERTLALIKPDAVSRGLVGDILSMIERSGLHLAALKMVRLPRAQAEAFYAVHRSRPFFESLTRYMSSGPIVCAVLEGEDAIRRYRELMGATNPQEAAEGTIRKRYGLSLEANAVHGSDAPAMAAFEVGYFFSGVERGEGYCRSEEPAQAQHPA